jgi:2-polyprenyl-6-methoxyphenol hydroxylase-like FAD-dependent oxidoreductase
VSEDILRTPVAIVGGGPVGLMLALLLDFHGVRSTVFNTEETTRWSPKGSTQGARTMEHMRRLGISESVRNLGLPADHPTDVVYLTRFGGYELARLRMPSAAEKRRAVQSSPKTDQIPEPLHRANQMYVERFLLEHARTRPNITLRFGWRVDRFADGGQSVAVTAVRERDGTQENWRADYLVGCDGGQGVTRRTLGIRYGGEEALQQAFLGGRMFANHVRSPQLARDYLAGNRAFQYWLVNPQFRSAIISVDGGDEFMLWTRPSEPGGDADAAAIAAIRRMTRPDLAVEVLAHHPWTAGIALVAERYGEGRIVLAGDSVHLFTPTGGFGMNTGVDDAANLAWKLAASVQGWGGPHLLASYEAERRPIALRNTTAAHKLARNVGAVTTPLAMEDETQAGDAARREVGAYLATFGEEFASIGVQLGARYDGSPIIAENGTPPADDLTTYTASGVPGGRAPHLWLDRGRGIGSSLFDRFSAGFTLLRLDPRAPDGTALLVAAQKAGVPLTLVALADDAARDLYGCDLALIRPDQHIAWRGNDLPGDCELLLARVTGGN